MWRIRKFRSRYWFDLDSLKYGFIVHALLKYWKSKSTRFSYKKADQNNFSVIQPYTIHIQPILSKRVAQSGPKNDCNTWHEVGTLVADCITFYERIGCSRKLVHIQHLSLIIKGMKQHFFWNYFWPKFCLKVWSETIQMKIRLKWWGRKDWTQLIWLLRFPAKKPIFP